MGKADDHNYGVVLDAGSSGTRVYIYKWLKNVEARKKASKTQLASLPELETKDKWTKKVHPGVSTFGETPEKIGPDHLKELLKHALKYVPKEAVSETPIFVLATAGMRLLPDYQRKQLLARMCSYIRSESKFLLPDCDQHVQVIPGDTEGLYGWIAANYLLGGFDAPQLHNHGKGHHTYGFLDMGGASAQIAFAPNATEADKHADDLKLVRFRNVAGEVQEHRVFVTTWLGFGVNEARKRYTKALMESYGLVGSMEMPDPCLPAGLLLSTDGDILPKTSSKVKHLIGTGKFDECMRRTFPLLEKAKPCKNEPCLLNGVHVPGIDFDVNHFIGISEYWHTTHEIFGVGEKEKAYDFNTYQKKVKQFCEQDWSTIEEDVEKKKWGKKVGEKTAYEVCFKASWLINVLHDGIGVPRVGLEHTPNTHNGTKEVIQAAKDKGFIDSFQAMNEIKDIEISWTMGKMLLYASADVPSAKPKGLPVGFGSNEVGVDVPADFQYPGGGRLQEISEDGSQSLTDTLSSSIFRSGSAHRVPGFLFFMLIMVIAVFYLCGRERRSRIYTSYFGARQGNGASSAYSKSSGKTRSNLGKVGQFVHRILSSTTIGVGRGGAGGKGSPSEFKRDRRERDLEDGATARLYDPSEFELGDMGTSSSDDEVYPADGRTIMTKSHGKTHTASSSSSSTLSVSALSTAPNSASSRPQHHHHSHNLNSTGNISGPSSSAVAAAILAGGNGTTGTGANNGVGGRSSPDLFLDRHGLALRIESREDLTGMNLGGRKSKSRAGSVSPTRFSRV